MPLSRRRGSVVVVAGRARTYSKQPPPGRRRRARAHSTRRITRAQSRRRPDAKTGAADGRGVFLINICTGLACPVIYSVYQPRLRLRNSRAYIIIVIGDGVLIGRRRRRSFSLINAPPPSFPPKRHRVFSVSLARCA